jgi:hypothetical protein
LALKVKKEKDVLFMYGFRLDRGRDKKGTGTGKRGLAPIRFMNRCLSLFYRCQSPFCRFSAYIQLLLNQCSGIVKGQFRFRGYYSKE